MLRGRYEEAAEQLEAARELAEGDVARAQIEGKLGELAFKRGDAGTAGAAIERALRVLGEPVPRHTATFLAFALREVAVQLLHTCLPRLFLARRPLEGAERERLVIRLCSRLAYAYWFTHGKVPCLWAHLRGMNLAERYPPTLELAQAYSNHAPVMTLIPHIRRGIAYVERSLAIRTELGDLWDQGQSLHFYGIILYAAARFTECIEKCRAAVRLLERTGDYWEVNIARYQIAASLYRLGDLRGAIEEARRVHQSGLRLGDAQAAGISLDVWACASGGRVPLQAIQEELRRPRGDVQGRAQVLLAEGVRLMGAGLPDQAIGILEQAQQIAQEAGIGNAWVAPILPWLATALRRAAQQQTGHTPGRRRALLRRAEATARRALQVARRRPTDLRTPCARSPCWRRCAAGRAAPAGCWTRAWSWPSGRGRATSTPRPCWRAATSGRKSAGPGPPRTSRGPARRWPCWRRASRRSTPAPAAPPPGRRRCRWPTASIRCWTSGGGSPRRCRSRTPSPRSARRR
jgi:two-component system sensor kinase